MGTQQGSDDADSHASGTERIAAFSDGVIAIIITIMVLELKLPEAAASGDVWSNFVQPLTPKLAFYALSFVIVGALWINHHQLLSAARRATPELMWLNLLLLFPMSLLPLATGFLGEHRGSTRAVAFYAVLLAANSAVFGLMRYRLGRVPDHDQQHIQFKQSTVIRSIAATVLYCASAVLAQYSTSAALALLVFVPIMFNIPMLLRRSR